MQWLPLGGDASNRLTPKTPPSCRISILSMKSAHFSTSAGGSVSLTSPFSKRAAFLRFTF